MSVSKLHLIGIAAGVAAVVCSCGQTPQAAAPAEPFQPSAGAVDSVSYLLGVNLGATIAANDFGDLKMDRVLEGMKDYLAAKGQYTDEGFAEQFEIDPTLMNVVINDYLDQVTEYRNWQNAQVQEKFFEENIQKDSTIVVDSLGFQYKILEIGRKTHPADTSIVSICFTCSLPDGTIVDQAKVGYPRKVDLKKVCKGLAKGLTYIGEGGTIDLYVPSDLAYGKEGVRGVPPGSMLIFNVSLFEVKKPKENK